MRTINDIRPGLPLHGGMAAMDLATIRLQVAPVPGIYVVTLDSSLPRRALARSVGGHFKGVNPTIDPGKLVSHVVEGSDVLYIGRAKDLRRRIGELARFGMGRPVGHRGGSRLWQLTAHADLRVWWSPTDEPAQLEAELIGEYADRHGSLPFANSLRPRSLAAA